MNHPNNRIFENRDDQLFSALPSCLVGASFDGASVMMGKNNSVASRFSKLVPSCVITHGVAHLLELSYTEAFSSVPFLAVIEEILAQVYS